MNHPKHDRTLVVLKPDAIQRTLIGEITSRFERVGLKLVALKMFIPNAEFVEKHYTLWPGWKQSVGEKNIKGYQARGLKPPTEDPLEAGQKVLDVVSSYVTSGPVIAMVWQGAHAVEIVRKLVGSTEPLASDVGTIRGDYVLDSYVMSAGDNRSIRNLIHASGTEKEAEQEIEHWFSKEEIMEYTLIAEAVIYEQR